MTLDSLRNIGQSSLFMGVHCRSPPPIEQWYREAFRLLSGDQRGCSNEASNSSEFSRDIVDTGPP